MKLRPRPSRIILPYLFLYFLVVTASYFPVAITWPPTLTHYFVFALWTIAFTIFIIIGLRLNSYEIHKNTLVHIKGKERLNYNFADIIYIDEKHSRKHKTMLFYTNKGDERHLVLDPKGILLEKTLERAKNVVSYEEFRRRFPKTKL